MNIRPRQHSIPNLNLASMPDLIFTVLFFFIIVTHMRNVTPSVEYRVPEGSQLAPFAGQQDALYIYIGRSHAGSAGSKAPERAIQVNNRLVDIAQLSDAVAEEKARLSASQRQQLVALIKADRNTSVETIIAVKKALRQNNVLRLSYSATQQENEK